MCSFVFIFDPIQTLRIAVVSYHVVRSRVINTTSGYQSLYSDNCQHRSRRVYF